MVNSNQFDCIVVGAGPAGGTAAYHLAKRDRSVLVLDKAKLPRYKPCGGGVSPQVAQWFDFDFSPAVSLKVTSLRYTWRMDDPIEIELDTPEPIWMVRRDIFDHFLVQQAQKQGAQLRDETEVKSITFKDDAWQVHTEQGDFRGRYLIAADGGRGPLAQWLGFKQRQRRLAGALECEVPAQVQDTNTIHFEFGLVKNGYLWNFPKADGYSIGVGTFRGGTSQPLRQITAEYASLFNLDLSNSQQYVHPLSLWDGQQKLHTQNALLAGEAACLVDPFTAEGIRPSIFSGMKAAIAIDQALSGDLNALDRYTQIIHEEWGQDLIWAERLARVFYRVPQLGYKLGIKRPSATRKMSQILCGELRYADVAQRALQRLSGGLLTGA